MRHFKDILTSRAKSKYAIAVAMILLVFLVHASYINNGFVWLDHGDIEQGSVIFPLTELIRAFVLPFGATDFYRPLVAVIHSVDVAIYRLRASGFHVTNILLHLGAVVGAVLFARAFFLLNIRDSILTALIFGIHPLSWLPVGVISYRQESMLALFTFLAVSFHIKSRLTHSWFYGVSSVFAFSLALFSKETAFVLIPVFIVWWELCQLFTHRSFGSVTGPGFLQFFSLARILFLCEIAVVTVYAWLRFRVVSDIWSASSHNLSFVEAITTGLAGFGRALVHLVNPLKPGLSDAFPIGGSLPIIIIAGVFIVAGMVTVYRLGVNSKISRITFFMMVSLAPTLNIIPLPRFTSPHYAYVASLGVGALALVVLDAIRIRYKKFFVYVVSLLVLWVLAMAISTFLGGFQFKDDAVLFEPEVKHDSNFAEGSFYLGTYYFQKQEYARAELEYESALSADKNMLVFLNRPALIINLARVKAQRRDYTGADMLLIKLGQDEPAFLAFTLFNRALFWAFQENDKMVIELLRSVPGGWQTWQRPEPLQLLQQSLINLGRLREADEVNLQVSKFFSR